MMPALYAEQGLCSGGTSVCSSVCTIDYQQQQRPAGFLLSTLWAGDISWQQWARCRCGAAGASAQQQMWTVSHSQMMEEPEHRLVWFVGSLCVVFHRTVTFNTDTHMFNGPLSRTTRLSRYQKGKTNLDLLKQETVSGNGISWAMCKSAPRSRQITTPAPHHSVFYRPDALPATQPTASKHWRQNSHRFII